ncbi:MAG: hypothetical protein Q9207_007868 [Kuettlingeria erythrocarpa]
MVIALVVGWGLLAATQTWAFCVPVAYGWDTTIRGGHCANRNAGYLAVGIIDAVTDFLILCLPLPMILRLKIPRARQEDNFTDSRTLLDVLSAIEPAISILVASSFTYAPVIEKYFSRRSSATSTRKNPFWRMPESPKDNLHAAVELPATKTVVQGPDGLAPGSEVPSAAEHIRPSPGLNRIAVEHSVVVDWEGERS